VVEKKSFFIDLKAKAGKFSPPATVLECCSYRHAQRRNGKKDIYLVSTPFPSVIDHDGLPGT